MEVSDVIREIIANPRFRERVRVVAATKAVAILAEPTPDASELAWAKLTVAPGYDAWMEALLVLIDTAPANPAVAYDALDTAYATKIGSVLPEVIKAKGL